MNDSFQQIINRHRARVATLRESFELSGYLLGASTRDPSYRILLSRNYSSEAPFRVTSFRDGEPVGHREYDRLEGGSPIQAAFQEFSGRDMRLIPRGALTAYCTRTRVIGTGNSFEVLIPLSEINPAGQTYRIISPDLNNREFVPFHLGIEPYASEIIRLPQGFERYERYQSHGKASKAKELAILQHAFPESHLTELPFLWDQNYLADKDVTLHVDRQGNLIMPTQPAPLSRNFHAQNTPQ